MTSATFSSVSKIVELPGRVRLDYVEQGDPAGIPVVMLHGITDSWHSFERVLPRLPASIHAFALSQRGHGDSDRPATGYDPRDFAADVAAFMDAVEVGPAVIVGHSMGGTIAQAFAIAEPKRTLGLVLLSTPPTFRGNPSLVELWDTAVATLTDPIDAGFVREFQESTLAQPVSPSFIDTAVRESLKVPARVWRAALKCLIEADLSGELGKITAPTLTVWGDQDDMVSRSEQDALTAAIAGSRLVVYPGAGHAVHWDEPERAAADVAAFVERLAG